MARIRLFPNLEADLLCWFFWLLLLLFLISYYVIKMEYSSLKRQFLKAESTLDALWGKQTHCSKQIIHIVLSWGIRHVFWKETWKIKDTVVLLCIEKAKMVYKMAGKASNNQIEQRGISIDVRFKMTRTPLFLRT